MVYYLRTPLKPCIPTHEHHSCLGLWVVHIILHIFDMCHSDPFYPVPIRGVYSHIAHWIFIPKNLPCVEV